MENNKIFANGMICKTPSEKAPKWVIANLSFKVDEFIAFLQKNDNNGWVNIDIKLGKTNKMYGELNTFKPGEKKENNAPSREELTDEEIGSDSIPF